MMRQSISVGIASADPSSAASAVQGGGHGAPASFIEAVRGGGLLGEMEELCPDTMPMLAKGDKVRVQGLKGAKELNGSVATVVRIDTAKRYPRVVVDVPEPAAAGTSSATPPPPTTRTVALKLANIDPLPLPPGRGNWRPPAEDLKSMPLEWFVTRPKFSNYRNTQLWGWRTDLENAMKMMDAAKVGAVIDEQLGPRGAGTDELRLFLEMRIVLTRAARMGAADVCKALVAKGGAHVDGVHGPALSAAPMYRACQSTSGDSGNAVGMSPLLSAIYEQRTAVTQYLVSAKADINLPSGNAAGILPLHMAATRCNKAIVRILLMGGADVTSTDRHGLMAHEVADMMSQGTPGQVHDARAGAVKKFRSIIEMLTPDENGEAPVKRRCDACNAPCGKLSCPCKLAHYCNAACQKAHWKAHKPDHKGVTSLA